LNLVNIFQDFGRWSKNRLKGGHQFFALPIIGTLGSLTPIFVTSAHSYLWGEFQWYMPAVWASPFSIWRHTLIMSQVIEKFDSRAAKFFTAFSFMLAT
jgi:cytosine/uracil/thiamine/allantoin permease